MKHSTIYCAFSAAEAEAELSLISEPSHDSLSRISFKALQGTTVMTSLPLHTSEDCAGER